MGKCRCLVERSGQLHIDQVFALLGAIFVVGASDDTAAGADNLGVEVMEVVADRLCAQKGPSLLWTLKRSAGIG
jgi:hypothetical protein